MSQMSITRTRIQRLMDESATVRKLHEDLLAQAESRSDEPGLNEVEKSTVESYRVRSTEIDEEIEQLHGVLKQEDASAQVSQLVRQHLAGGQPGMSLENGEVKYRTFAVYARDVLVTKHGETFQQIAELAGGDEIRNAARERLMRAPTHTLSSDVEGLQPEQHIAQILQVIDASRPLVASAQRVNLTRGRITFPKITGRPVVALQVTEKTEGGNHKLQVDMIDAVASTYIGGGNLSWQTIEWSTPDALDLWFRLAAAHYALMTEQDAGEVIQSAAADNLIADQLAGTSSDTFADWILAVTEGAAEVYANSGAMADTLYLAPDMFYLAAALTSAAGASLVNAGQLNVGAQSGVVAGLKVVVSRGLDAGVAIVGDSSGFLVAETAGAPVQLRAVEPAIGGLEVGIIGAFEAVAVEDERFALIGTAS